MSPREYTQRCAAIVVTVIATVALGVAAERTAGEAGQYQAISAAGIPADSITSIHALSLQGHDVPVLASRERNTPWQIRLQHETAWLISPYLIERHNHGRWSTLNA